MTGFRLDHSHFCCIPYRFDGFRLPFVLLDANRSKPELTNGDGLAGHDGSRGSPDGEDSAGSPGLYVSYCRPSTGRQRELAQLNPFDLVVLLTLSNTVQNAIIGNDNSVIGVSSGQPPCWL